MLEDLPLDPAVHDREGFECGVQVLDDYVRRFAEQHRRRGISSVFVLADSARPEHILGYYTLSAAEIEARKQVAAYALIVDAKDNSAQAFYLHFGFKARLDAKRTLYLPLGR